MSYLGGSRPVTDIGVGECFDLSEPEADTIGDVTQRDCTEAHAYEMYFVGDLPDGPYPSVNEVDLWVEANCLPAFTEYVGLEYQTSQLDFTYITPVEDGWNDGDHSVQCALFDPQNAELTESMKDAAR